LAVRLFFLNTRVSQKLPFHQDLLWPNNVRGLLRTSMCVGDRVCRNCPHRAILMP